MVPESFVICDEVRSALAEGRAIVALESTVIAHGLPRPLNLETALRLEQAVRDRSAIPATIAILNGRIHVGLSRSQLEHLATAEHIYKVSRRDLPIALARRWDAATTVATTLWAAHSAGVRVFATGGIGGVHRGALPDISADLPELQSTPSIVVCSGAKSVLDLPATREWLETHGVTIVGYRCEELPAFYVRKSGLPVDVVVNEPAEVVRLARARDELQLHGAILVTVPVPASDALDELVVEELLARSLIEAESSGVRGRELTPFLLARMSEASGGSTLRANIALLENNAKVAAEIAVSFGQ